MCFLSHFAAKKSNTWAGLLSNPFWKSEHVMSIEFHFLSPMVVLSSKKPNQMVKLAFPFLEAISLCSRCVFLSVFPVLISEKDFLRHFLQLKFNDILRYGPTLLLIYGSVISTWTYWTSTKTSWKSKTYRSFPATLVINLSSLRVNNKDFHLWEHLLTPKTTNIWQTIVLILQSSISTDRPQSSAIQMGSFLHHRNHKWDKIFLLQNREQSLIRKKFMLPSF